MSEKQRNTVLRFAVVFLMIAALFVLVIAKIIAIQTVEREQWLRIAESQIRTNQPIPATRGNILDTHGRLMASSLPQYTIHFDPRVEALHLGGDTLFTRNVDSIAAGLSRIIGDKTAEEYRQVLVRTFRAGKIKRLTRTNISYTQRKEIMQLPLVRRGLYKSGIYFEDMHRRVKPFGSLASRTIGSIYGEDGHGNAGLEKRFDRELSGTDGVSTRQRIGGRWENVTVVEAIDGQDVVTTIDADIQDIAETALRAKLEYTQADWGCCMLMETHSGKIRAIVNLDRTTDGRYMEMMNHAVTRVEPGSTFKTIAMMAAMDDGKIDLYDTVSVTSAPWQYFSVKHTDAHKNDTIYTVRSALAVSSNIAFAKLITRSYEGSAKKFVRRIEKTGLMDSIYCDIPGAQSVKIPVPKDTVTLSKMAYGYSVELSPMHLMMFYNAIANNGRMIRPYLVERIEQNGEVVKRFSTETINSSICRSSTLRDVRLALHDVVWDDNLGTASVRKWKGKTVARKAQSDLVHIAGKTGTAQLFMERKYWGTRHRMTFVGYFPEEAPEYTCICMINYPKNYPGYDAGYDCGGVVRQIAEKVVAQQGRYVVGKDGGLNMKFND